MVFNPAPAAAAGWLREAWQRTMPPEPGTVGSIIPAAFERLVAVPHETDPPTSSPSQGQLSPRLLAGIGDALETTGRLFVGIWAGAPTTLRDEPTALERFEARPGIECYLGTADFDDLLEAHESPMAVGQPASANVAGNRDYIHRMGRNSLKPLAVPYLWWPESRDWLVVTDIDLTITLVGCAAAAAQSLYEGVDATVVDSTTRFTDIAPA